MHVAQGQTFLLEGLGGLAEAHPAHAGHVDLVDGHDHRHGVARLDLVTVGGIGANDLAHLVVQRHLGSDSLLRWLVGQGHATTRRSSRAGYRLLDVAAASPVGP